MSDELIRKHEGHVTRLTLNRPHKANALCATLVEALIDSVDYACTDGTRLLILEGSGSHFCAGFDFTDYQNLTDGELALRFLRIEVLLQSVYHAPCETLALAHGRTFGAGADLIASCGMRVATPEAAFRMPGLRFGVVLGTRRFASRVGADRAREILGNSRVFEAEEALATGFLTRIAARDEWDRVVASARANCERLTPAAAQALHRHTIRDTRAEDMAALARSVSTPGLKERIRSFRDESK
jgi:enoyl-CoA hydratase/carnithine racemase